MFLLRVSYSLDIVLQILEISRGCEREDHNDSNICLDYLGTLFIHNHVNSYMLLQIV